MMVFNSTGEVDTTSTNGTRDFIDNDSRHLVTNVALSFTMALIVLVSVGGNCAVITVTFIDEALKDETGNYFIAFMSSSDVVNALFVILPSLVAVACDYWPFGEAMCSFQNFALRTCFCSSAFILAIISFDRALRVIFPFKYKRIMSKKLANAFCAFNVILSMSISASLSHYSETAYSYWNGICRSDVIRSRSNKPVFIICWILGAFLPLFVFTVCYLIIIFKAKSLRKKVHPTLEGNRAMNKDVEKSIKSMLIVALVFYLSFLPVILLGVLEIEGIVVSPHFIILRFIIFFTSSAVNPFIYGILRKDYHDAYKRLARKLYINLAHP